MAHPNGDIAEILKQTAVKSEEPTSKPEPEPIPSSKRPPSREGKKGFTVHLSVDAHTQLKLMALETGTPMHDLMINALNTLFELNNKPPIA